MNKVVVWSLAASLGFSAPLLANEEHEKGHKHTVVKFDELPPAVQDAFNQEAQGGKIEELRKEKEAGKVVYEAEVVRNGKGRDLEVSADGKVLKRGTEHDEENEAEHSQQKLP
jgi:hypothetical protein